MTDLAVIQGGHDVAPVVTTTEYLSNPTGGRLVAWAEAAKAAGTLGAALSSTAFVPAAFRGKPAECAAAIMCGDEIGLSPLAALRSIFVINGTPGMYARTMVAVVQSLGHEVVVVTDTPAKVVVKGRRKGTEEWTTAEWTTDRARRAGYTNNKKYETDPQAMLYARAASDVCRRIAADALLGIPYSVEELELEQPAPTGRVSRSTTTTRVSRAAAPEQPEPPLEDEPSVPAEAEPVDAEIVEPPLDEPAPSAGPGATQAQISKMGVLFRANGLTDRDEALAYVASVIGRPVESRNDLTKAEASQVIDDLEASLAADVAEPAVEDGAA